MTIHIDTSGLDRFGWMRIDGAVPAGLCERLVEILEAEMDVLSWTPEMRQVAKVEPCP